MPHKVERPYSDIDRMLAEHDQLYGERNEALLTGRPHRPPPAPEPEPTDETPYGAEPRKDWPKFARWWTPELIAERRWWTRKYIEDEGRNLAETAAIIGVHPTTIRADAHHLGLKQGPVKFAAGNARLQRRDARREEIRRLFEQNLGIQEIAGQLSVHSTTVSKDLQAMGLTRPKNRVVNGQVVAMTTKALVVMDDMAQLLLNLPDLETIQIDEEQAQAWLKQLRRIVRAAGRVRKTTKGTQP